MSTAEEKVTITITVEDVELLKEQYITPRQFDGQTTKVTGEIAANMSANYCSIRIMSSVELPVDCSLTEIRSGQHLSINMAREQVKKALNTVAAEDLKEVIKTKNAIERGRV